MSLMRLQLDKKCKDADRLGDLAVWADYDNCKRQSGEALSDFVTRYEWAASNAGWRVSRSLTGSAP